MVSTSEVTQCPAQPKRGWILVADDSLGEQVLKSGLIIPKEIASHITRARILELGLPPIDFRTGGERQWDYHEQRVDRSTSAAGLASGRASAPGCARRRLLAGLLGARRASSRRL